MITNFKAVFFMDVQCHYDFNGHLYVKELFIRSHCDNFTVHSTYKMPRYVMQQVQQEKFVKANRFTTSHIHHIGVEEGVRPYWYIFTDIQRMVDASIPDKTLIYVAGKDKMRLLINLMNGIENSGKYANSVAPEGIVVYDVNTQVANKQMSCRDRQSLDLKISKADRRSYLKTTYLSGKEACIFHTSENCAKLNALYLSKQYWLVMNEVRKEQKRKEGEIVLADLNAVPQEHHLQENFEEREENW